MRNRRPRLDSQRVQFLFDNIRMGLGFVEVARGQSDPRHRAAMLSYAKLACKTTLRLLRLDVINPKDRKRIVKQLQQLGSAIEATR